MKAIMAVIAAVILSGCVMAGPGQVTAQKCPPCPPEDAYFLVGPGIPVMVPKGFFDDSKDDNWTGQKEYDEAMKESQQRGRQSF